MSFVQYEQYTIMIFGLAQCYEARVKLNCSGITRLGS